MRVRCFMGGIREAAPYGLLLLVCSTPLQNYPLGSSAAGGFVDGGF